MVGIVSMMSRKLSPMAFDASSVPSAGCTSASQRTNAVHLFLNSYKQHDEGSENRGDKRRESGRPMVGHRVGQDRGEHPGEGHRRLLSTTMIDHLSRRYYSRIYPRDHCWW